MWYWTFHANQPIVKDDQTDCMFCHSATLLGASSCVQRYHNLKCVYLRRKDILKSVVPAYHGSDAPAGKLLGYLIWDCLALCWLHRQGDVLLRCVSPGWCVCVAFPQGDVVLRFPPGWGSVVLFLPRVMCCFYPRWCSVAFFFLLRVMCCVVLPQGNVVLCYFSPGWCCVVFP